MGKLFASLFHSVSGRKETVADNQLGGPDSQYKCLIGLHDFTRGEEQQSIRELLEAISGTQIANKQDRLVCRDGSSEFTVKQCYQRILSFRLPFFYNGIFRFDWEKVWVSEPPSKVAFLIWLIVCDKVLTQLNLQKRAISQHPGVNCVVKMQKMLITYYVCT